MLMPVGLGLLVAVVVIILLVLKLRGSSDADDTAPTGAALPYRLTGRFLSQAELAFYHAATDALAGQAVLCPKVTLAHIFDVTGQADRQAHRNRIDRKHVDFLLCEPAAMQPRAGIILSNPAGEKDEFVARVFSAAGLPLLRLPAKPSYSPQEIAQLVAALQRREVAAAAITPIVSQKAPTCPKCRVELVVRTQRQGGNRFYGCPNYPACRHTAPID